MYLDRYSHSFRTLGMQDIKVYVIITYTPQIDAAAGDRRKLLREKR